MIQKERHVIDILIIPEDTSGPSAQRFHNKYRVIEITRLMQINTVTEPYSRQM